jgi:PAP_fibrillin
MDTVEIKGSNLPGIQQLFNTGAIKLKSRDLAQALEDVSSQLPFDYKTPRPIVTTTYLSPTLRIIRDQDGKVFVYTKLSERTEPKDYSSVMPDLGIGKLLEGINDTFIKYYI